MKFSNDEGDKFSLDDIQKDIDESISELDCRMGEILQFKAKLEAGKLKDGDNYLSFGQALFHGYDRTGPSCMTVTEVKK